MTRPRPLVVAVLAVLAAGSLAGCQSDPATAAYIGRQQISTAQVDHVVALDAAAGSRRDATLNSLNVLVQTALLRTVARDMGADVTPAVIAQAREDADIRSQAAQFGVRPEAFAEFAAYLLTVQRHLAQQLAGSGQLTPEQVTAVQDRVSGLRAQAAKDAHVRVNPRYGAFDPQRVAVTPAVEPGIKPVTQQAAPQP
ncbi:MAG TPA: hypothetical protein VGD72_03195 [Mycobacteriales bacterium]